MIPKLVSIGTEPITLAEAKLHLRVDDDLAGPSHTEDSLITSLIKTAREYVESVTWQKIPEQVWDFYYDEWPVAGYFELFAPLAAVAGVYYTPDGESEAIFADVETDLPGNRVLLKTDKSWPTDTLRQVTPIRVRFTAKTDPVPSSLKAAMLLYIRIQYDVLRGGGQEDAEKLLEAVDQMALPYRESL